MFLKEKEKKKKGVLFWKTKQYEKYLKYGTSCLVSTDPPGLGGATVGEVWGGERRGDLGGHDSLCSSLNTGAGGRLKLELDGKNSTAFRLTEILKPTYFL